MDGTKSTVPAEMWNDEARESLRHWDPAWESAYGRLTDLSDSADTLSRKLTELIGIAVNAACTSLNPQATRRHIAGALAAGATRDEILFVIKCASVMAIHTMSLGAPILLEEANTAGESITPPDKMPPTPACDAMRAVGQWNAAWDPFFALDPQWTDAFMASGASIYTSGVLPAKDIELLSIAFDASFTHMYAPGTRRHIRNALVAGATPREIMAVLKLCVAHGVQTCNMAVPILDEQLKLADASEAV